MEKVKKNNNKMRKTKKSTHTNTNKIYNND